jgi:hypothetical protein
MGLRTGVDRLASVLNALALISAGSGLALLVWGFIQWGFGDINAILGAAIIGGGGYAIFSSVAWVLRGFASTKD